MLFLDLPPHHVDSNVHPTKYDVRLRYASQVFDAVRASISATLKAHAAARFAEQTGGTASGIYPGRGKPGHLALWPGARRERAAEPIAFAFSRSSTARSSSRATATRLLLVDQHAAHERIAYEAIVAAAAQRTSSEPLLVPQIVELDAARSAELDRLLEALREGGLEIEAFGERTYRIVATPCGLRVAQLRSGRHARRSQRGSQAARRSRARLGNAGVP